MNTTLSATEARNRFFELLDLAKYKRETFIIEKDGEVVATIGPTSEKPSIDVIHKILTDMRRIFAKSAKRKQWSVVDSQAWKKKEKKYLEDLSKGIVK